MKKDIDKKIKKKISKKIRITRKILT